MRVLKGSSQRQMFSCRDNASEWPGKKESSALDLFLGLQVLPPPDAVILLVLGRSHDCRHPGLCELLKGTYHHTKVHPQATAGIFVIPTNCPTQTESL